MPLLPEPEPDAEVEPVIGAAIEPGLIRETSLEEVLVSLPER